MRIEYDMKEDYFKEEMSLRRNLQGVLFFRLILGVFFLLLTIIVQSRREEDLLSAHLQPLYYFSCILFIFTIVAALSLGRTLRLKKFAYTQMFFDVAAVTFLIFLSGGVDSLFSFLYMPVIISSAVLLHRRGSLLTASMCGMFYGLLLDLQYFGWISPLQIVSETVQLRDSGTYFHGILMNIAAFYVVAFVSGYLAEELQKSSRKILKQAKDLHQLEMLHRNIVHSITSGLITLDPSGLVLFCNNFAQEILGLRSEEIQGRSFSSIFPSLEPMSWPREPGAFQKTRRGPADRMEISYHTPLGEELYLGYTVSVLHSADGEWSGWIFIFQDLTRLKEMEEHLGRMERLIVAGRVAAEIAHEIKNPLAAMSGAVQMLRDESVEGSRQSRLMSIIHREVNRMNGLVKDFLWLAKGAYETQKIEDVDICPIIREILELLRAQGRISSVHRISTMFECTPVSQMDPYHLRQILWNLFLNALEAMPDGGDLTISVNRRQTNGDQSGEARIDIDDGGTGIPAGMRERIFEPFFTSKGHGTGLGLSIVYQLLQRSGGRLEITHHQDRPGTTFTLFFPIAPSFSLAK